MISFSSGIYTGMNKIPSQDTIIIMHMKLSIAKNLSRTLLHALFLLMQFFSEKCIFDSELLDLRNVIVIELAQFIAFLFFLVQHPILEILQALHLCRQGIAAARIRCRIG